MRQSSSVLECSQALKSKKFLKGLTSCFIMSVSKIYHLLFTKSSAKISKIATSVQVAGNLARKSGSKQYTVQGKQTAT